MNRWLASLTILGIYAAFGIPSASAQIGGYNPPQTNPNPNFSPYLNLIPNNPYIQYFGLGQQQMNNSRALQQLQSQVNFQQTGYLPMGMGGPNMGGQPTLMMTGHPVTFQNMSHYFPAPGMPYAGMGMNVGGLGGTNQTIYTPLPQGYAAPIQR